MINKIISEISNKIKDDNILKEMNELTKLILESNERVSKQLDHLNKEILAIKSKVDIKGNRISRHKLKRRVAVK